MTNFEKLTKSPETLGAFLASLPCVEGPWDGEFQDRFCVDCGADSCDDCPNERYRNNPGWWLGLEAGPES